MFDKVYKIIHRSATAHSPNDLGRLDFADRNYNVPLVGCSNFAGKIATGDILGVKLVNNANHSVKFHSCSRFLSQDKMDILPDQFGSFKHVEEHLFLVTKVISPSKFDVVPYLLNSDKVIVKAVRESFTKEWAIPVKAIEKYTLCNEFFCEKSLQASSLVSSEYESFFCRPTKLRNVVQSLMEGAADSGDNEKDMKTLRRLVPFKDLSTTVFDAKDLTDIEEFYDILTQYRDIFIRVLGEEQVVKLGSLDCVDAHMTALYNLALTLIDSETVLDTRVEHSYCAYSRLSVPLIRHNIVRVKLSEVFRVYKPDPTYVLCRTLHVSNWGGVILDEAVRQHITTGNIVRVLFGRNDWDPETGMFRNSAVIYCRVLLKLDATRCLACIENMYCSEYEDIVFVIDVRAVTEVPFEFAGNENLAETGLDRKSGEGFCVTGMGAVVTVPTAALAVASIEQSDVASLVEAEGQQAIELEKETFALNYSGLF